LKLIIIIFCVFRFSATEKDRDKGEGNKEKAGLKEMKKKEYHSKKFFPKTKKQQHPYPILNIMHELQKFRALF